MTVEQIIETRLREAFTPVELEIINESHLHRGHASSPGTGESHFRINIVSSAFRGQSRIACHRMVNDVLADILSGPVHAMALKASAPPEEQDGS